MPIDLKCLEFKKIALNLQNYDKFLKQQTDYFYYFKIELPNEENAYLHLGKYNTENTNKEPALYLYSIPVGGIKLVRI